MNYSGIKSKDVANGIGFGVSLFVSGCHCHCKGCFNHETWDFCAGEEFTDKVLDKIYKLLDRPYVDFFSILGGDPFEPENRVEVLAIVSQVRAHYPNLKINIWSHWHYEESIKDDILLEILNLCDMFVDGEFILEKKDLHLPLRGSSNQRIIDLNASRDKGELVLFEDLMQSTQ